MIGYFLGFFLVIGGCSLDPVESEGRSSLGNLDQSGSDSDNQGDDEAANQISTSLTYYDDAKPLLDKYCAECHAVPPTGGADASFRLDVYDVVDNVPGAYEKRLRIAARVKDEASPMPPVGYKNISSLDKDKLAEWSLGGAPMGIFDFRTPGSNSPVNNGTLRFTAPAVRSDKPNLSDIYQVGISSQGYSTNTRGSLYYQVKGSNARMALLVDRPLGELNNYAWDMSQLANGTYEMLAVVNGRTFVAEGSVFLNHPGAGNANPTLQFTGMWDGGGAMLIGDSMPLTYAANDSDGDPLSIKIEIGNHNGIFYDTVIVDGETSLSSHVFNGSALGLIEGMDYRVKATVSDGRGGLAVTESSASFGLAEGPITWQDDVRPVLLNKCDSCHYEDPGRSYDTSLYDTNRGAFSQRVDLVERTLSGNMPPGPAASKSQKQALQLWLWLGAARD